MAVRPVGTSVGILGVRRESVNTLDGSRIILGGQWQDTMNPAADQSGRGTPVSGIGRGQGPLLEALLGQFDRLKGFVMAMGLSVADAEDVLQDVSIQVLRQAAKGSQEGNLKAWLFKVTVNRVRLAHRRQGLARKANPTVPQQDPPMQVLDAQHQIIRDEEAQIISRALDEMDDSLRVPLVLRYFCDQDSSQIAEVLDLPASTVRSRLRAARLEMTRRLLEKGMEP